MVNAVKGFVTVRKAICPCGFDEHDYSYISLFPDCSVETVEIDDINCN